MQGWPYRRIGVNHGLFLKSKENSIYEDWAPVYGWFLKSAGSVDLYPKFGICSTYIVKISSGLYYFSLSKHRPEENLTTIKRFFYLALKCFNNTVGR